MGSCVWCALVCDRLGREVYLLLLSYVTGQREIQGECREDLGEKAEFVLYYKDLIEGLWAYRISRWLCALLEKLVFTHLIS